MSSRSKVASISVPDSLTIPAYLVTRITQLPRLPDMGLPTFSGTYETWFSFFDVFNSVMHLLTDLSDIQQCLFLTTYCTGEQRNVFFSNQIITKT